MSAVYVFTTSPWPKEAIPLGSVVPDRRYPEDEIVKGIVTKENDDFKVVKSYDFKCNVDLGSQTTLQGTVAAFWSTICSIFWKVESKGRFEVSAREARLYSLNQPTIILERLCEEKEARTFFQNCYRQGTKPSFVTGYRTLIDAKLEHKSQTTSTASGSGEASDSIGNTPSGIARSRVEVSREVNAGSCLEYRIEEEAIFAIDFREIHMKVYNKSELDISLKRPPNSWVIFSNTRGKPSDEEVIKVWLGENGNVKGSVPVFMENVPVFKDEGDCFTFLPTKDEDDSDDEE